jgi:deazaflavin-dependent oxidoreductase (nitroreductase family)
VTAQPNHAIPYPGDTVRFLLRAPLWLHRLGLGVVLDAFNFMILTTRGRKSGVPRATPLEFRRHGKKYYAIAAWGARSQWYQNLRSDPLVTLQQGGQSFSALATPVTQQAEALLVLHLFRRPNPLVYDAILARLANASTLDARTMPDLSGQYTIVRFDPQPGAPPMPPVPQDRRGVLGLLAAILVVVLLIFVLKGRKHV